MSEKYEFVDATLTECNNPFPVTLMCRWLSISRSGFYNWCTRPASATATRRQELKLMISAEFAAADEAAGYRRIHRELLRSGVQVGAELVRHLMRELGLVSCQPRPWRVSLTDSDTVPAAIPDLVRRDFTATAPGCKLVGDITYIDTWQGLGVPGHRDRLLLEEGHRLRPRRPLPHPADQRRHP